MKVKMEELQSKSDADLKKMSTELKRENMHIRFQKASGEAVKLSRIKEIRKTIARIKTIIRMREISGGNHA
jgi:large subunit ribosomal protein L29